MIWQIGLEGRRFTPAAGVAFLCIAAVACNLPVPRRINVVCCPKAAPPNLEFIQAGITPLDDVRSRLLAFDTGASEGGFSWARWYRRVSPIGWSGTSGQEPFSDDEFLEWKLVNLVVTAGSDGIVEHSHVCSEGRLARCLMDAAVSAPELSPPPNQLEFEAKREAATQWGTDRFHGKLLISQDQAVLDGFAGPRSQPGPPFHAGVALSKMTGVRVRYGSTQEAVALSIHFPSGVGLDHVRISATPARTWQLIRILHSVRSGPRRS